MCFNNSNLAMIVQYYIFDNKERDLAGHRNRFNEHMYSQMLSPMYLFDRNYCFFLELNFTTCLVNRPIKVHLVTLFYTWLWPRLNRACTLPLPIRR